MSYISTAFIVFLMVLTIIYHAITSKWKFGGGYILLLGSLFFYCCFDLKYLFFLLFSAASTYVCALLLEKSQKKKLILISCIAANAAVWLAVKVLPWALEMSSSLLEHLGLNISLDKQKLLVPVGISYFTLQAIAYLVDVWKGKFKAEKNPLHYLLFISYFPAIVQGPISRYDELMPKLLNGEKFSFISMRKGLLLALLGLVKKVVIADRIGIFVNACFAGYAEMTGVILYLGAVGYAIQLYMDFSGCVDICRGVSLLFNVDLPRNFNRPYLAGSIKEFWAKWHMTLSRWLKDYIYIPLGGNRKGTFRKYLNLLLTFLVSGLWHGAGFNFYLWGALHAVYQIVGQCTATFRKKLREKLGIKADSGSEKIYQVLITFNLVTFAWIFFRAPSVADAFLYIRQMFSGADLFALFGGRMFELGVSQGYFLVLLLHLIAFFAVEHSTQSQEAAIDGIIRQHLLIRWFIYLVMLFDVILLGAYGSGYDMSGFMYGGF